MILVGFVSALPGRSSNPADIDTPISTGGGAPEPNPDQIVMISEMGFTPAQARKALRESVSCCPHLVVLTFQSGNTEQAIEWLFSHPDDDGEETAPAPASDATPNVGGTPPPAKYRLKSFISHKGPSVHSGHYVATIRQPQADLAGGNETPDDWVLFNDEKVAAAAARGGDDLRSLAYLYIYERV